MPRWGTYSKKLLEGEQLEVRAIAYKGTYGEALSLAHKRALLDISGMWSPSLVFQSHKRLNQDHVLLRIMSIGATVNSAGGIVRVNHAPGSATRR